MLKNQLEITHVIFGDLYLQDIRDYREMQVSALGLEAVFPLWGRDTTELAGSMIQGGLKATISCVDTEQLAARFSGCAFDQVFLDSLPPGVDPCGENGEFHTLVHDGPMFGEGFQIETGEQRSEPRFVFTDLILTTADTES